VRHGREAHAPLAGGPDRDGVGVGALGADEAWTASRVERPQRASAGFILAPSSVTTRADGTAARR